MNACMKWLPPEKLPEKAMQLRKQTLNMMCAVGEGHVTSCFSCTELLVTLFYSDILQYNPGESRWSERDRFIMSKGHSCGILYAILADLGYFDPKEYERCTRDGSLLCLLLKHTVPGAEVSTGSLGIGFGMAAGMALAMKRNRKNPIVFVLLGDGECQEGAVWETAMFAAQYDLNNLVAIVDRNYMSCSDFTENTVGLEPFDEKWRAFGWTVRHINGHDFEEIRKALDGVHSRRGKRPTVIIADTVKGKGVGFIENKPLMHGAALNAAQEADACRELNGGICI